MRHPGEVLSRYQLLEHAWDYDYENRSNIVDVYVRYLRDKIDRPFGVNQLETVRGAGYRPAGLAVPVAPRAVWARGNPFLHARCIEGGGSSADRGRAGRPRPSR